MGKIAWPRWLLLASFLIVAAIVTTVLVMPRPVSVTVASASVGPIADSVADQGYARVREAYVVSAPVSGRLQRLELLHPGIFSLECLTVDGHEKRGQYVPSHIHMNVTYLLGAMDHELRQKPDENSGVAWFTPEEALKASTEPWMVQRVYSKLTQRAAAYMAR